MKFDWYVMTPTKELEETITRWPILDWQGFVAFKLPVFKKREFTGEVYDYAYLGLSLFRFHFSFSLTWNVKNVGSDEARRLWRERQKKVRHD